MFLKGFEGMRDMRRSYSITMVPAEHAELKALAKSHGCPVGDMVAALMLLAVLLPKEVRSKALVRVQGGTEHLFGEYFDARRQAIDLRAKALTHGDTEALASIDTIIQELDQAVLIP